MIKLHKFAFVVASAAFFFAGQASAQNAGTVTAHAFAIGQGVGHSGYTSLLCGSAQLAVGQSAADPICKTITGDVTISAAGVTSVGATKITSSMLNSDVFSTAHSWSGQQTFTAPVLGTPASGVATNLTGTASGLTAGHVTTNANLTGDVTSVGNAATLATVNSNTGSFGGASAVPSFTVNGKGLITAASSSAYQNGSASQKGIVQVDGTTITASGGVITAVGSAATSVAVGTTTISSGTPGAFLYDNGGTLANASPASKSDQQTGTSTTNVVTPAHQQDHDSANKLVAYVTQSGGTYSLNYGYNVASISKTSTGNVVVNSTTPFASTDFACVFGINQNAGATNMRMINENKASRTTSAVSVGIATGGSGGAAVDSDFSVICAGRQ